ncbi:hypothetical protein [Micromonospora aurantiaca (nom. illeg.)]|uniref:hypothetical protein n=1 Tax=Micromonospora aurantiaca (nom. illeg.) TaxID=47850 RepID=UPI0033C5C0B7
MRTRSIAIRAALVCAGGTLAVAAWSAADASAAHAADSRPAAVEQPPRLLDRVAELPGKVTSTTADIVDQVVPEPKDEPSPPTTVGVVAPIVEAVDEILAPVTEAVPPVVEPILDTTAPITAPITEPVLEVVQPALGAVTQTLPAAEPVVVAPGPRPAKPTPAPAPPAAGDPASLAPVVLSPVAAPAPLRPADDRAAPGRRQHVCDEAEARTETQAGVDRPAPPKRVTLAPRKPAGPCPAPITPGDLCQAGPVTAPAGQQNGDQLGATLTTNSGAPGLHLLRTLWPRADVAVSRTDHPEPGPA